MSNTAKYQHLSLEVRKERFKYVLLRGEANLDEFDQLGQYCLFVSPKETSCVLPCSVKVSNVTKEESGWECWQIRGEMPFGSVQGLIAEISGRLIRDKIGVCVISTFLTDFFFIKEQYSENARKTLAQIGWKIQVEE